MTPIPTSMLTRLADVAVRTFNRFSDPCFMLLRRFGCCRSEHDGSGSDLVALLERSESRRSPFFFRLGWIISTTSPTPKFLTARKRHSLGWQRQKSQNSDRLTMPAVLTLSSSAISPVFASNRFNTDNANEHTSRAYDDKNSLRGSMKACIVVYYMFAHGLSGGHAGAPLRSLGCVAEGSAGNT